ncbi:MAG: branched-chain amino acid ABC transporter substrate-binding protein [Caldilineaceae bacterium]|nr:branched-chain amino acid ABC transporter substrate-binding protein [Caldilineaceae bacterium]
MTQPASPLCVMWTGANKASTEKHPMIPRILLVLSALLLTSCTPIGLKTTARLVVVGPGESVHIRSIEALSGVSELGVPRQRAVTMAVSHFGPIKGYGVALGAPVDSRCDAQGGALAAQEVAADPRVVGVIGTSCSVAAAAASPILSGAGLVMISAGNTAPSLTSDLQGNAGSNYHPGYFRTIGNDIHQAQAVAGFVYNALGLRRMATIHDGDPYTSGLTAAFARSFVALGGRITASAQVRRGDVDMSAALTVIVAEEPQGIFFPLFPDEAGRVVRQINLVEGGAELVLINSESLLFTQLESVDAYLAGPDFDFTGNVNQATGRNAARLAAEYRQLYGETANPAYLALAYDAATLLLQAIEEVSFVHAGSLYIERDRLRDALTATHEFRGTGGLLSCDDFGDCGAGRVTISRYTDPSVKDVAELPVVYRYRP